MKTHNYIVTGPGQFPDDMLRYDQATVKRTIQLDGRTFYELEGRCAPTIGRWSSFLWVVIDTVRPLIEGR